MSDEPTETIGFDLGHGETAVARAMLEGNAQPEMLEIHGRKTQITAIGFHPQRGVVVGEQALTMPGIVRLQVGFKRQPTEDPAYRETLRQFLGTYYRLLLESGQIRGGPASQFLIGCPSGWSSMERGAYEALLREAEIPNVAVVPESRAALMHAKESDKFTVKELRAPILIVDIGSLTTDLTLLENLTIQPKDFGDNRLGGGLIDKAILAYTLERSEAAALRPILEQHPVYRARCELECRRIKENYFGNEEMYRDPETQTEGRVRIVAGQSTTLAFEPVLNGAIVEEILRRPIEALGQKTWAETFRDLLRTARARFDRDEIRLAVVLITGGASRMQFTHAIAAEVFPDSRLQRDSEPEFCIAKGLSRLGRWEHRVGAFTTKVDQLCGSSEIAGITKQRKPQLIEALGEALAKGIVANAVKPSLVAWREGRSNTLAEMEKQTQDLTKAWLSSGKANEAIGQQCANWLNVVQDDLARSIGSLCQEFQLPAGALSFEIAPDVSGISTDQIPAIDDPGELTGMTQMIVAVVIASILGGGGTALLLHGPVGWIIGLAIGLAVVAVGEDAAKDALKQADIPHFARGMLLSAEKTDSKCREMVDELAKSLSRDLAANDKFFLDLEESIRNQVQTALRARADDASILIH